MFYQRICHLNMQYKKVYGIRAPAGSVSRVREILRVMNSSPMLDVELTLGKKKKKFMVSRCQNLLSKEIFSKFYCKDQRKSKILCTEFVTINHNQLTS